MAQSLSEVKKDVIHVTEVVRHGEQITIPEDMTIEDAMKVLERRRTYENEEAVITSQFDCLPYDGAYALFNVLKARYGWTSMETVHTFFADLPPKLIDIDIDFGEVASIPWGRISLFKKDGYIDTGVTMKNGRYYFTANATVKRKHEKLIREIYADVRVELAKNSIYRGKALSIRFRDEDNDSLSMPDTKFVYTADAHRGNLIFSDSVQAIIDTNLFTPIERMEDCKRAHMKSNRKILLAGAFGVGKTLAAKVASALAVENKITFIYCKRAEEFAEAVQFATQYGPAIVFCEDIDRVLAGERSVKMDDILNIIDDIDTKSAEVMVVLTTNAPEKINPAGLRPGRLDAIIEITKPDAGAVERLIRMYGRGFLDDKADLQAVARSLAGNIPAVIEEVVKRSKLAALKMTPKGTPHFTVGEQALNEAAETMRMQLALLNPQLKASNTKRRLAEALLPIFREINVLLEATEDEDLVEVEEN